MTINHARAGTDMHLAQLLAHTTRVQQLVSPIHAAMYWRKDCPEQLILQDLMNTQTALEEALKDVRWVLDLIAPQPDKQGEKK